MSFTALIWELLDPVTLPGFSQFLHSKDRGDSTPTELPSIIISEYEARFHLQKYIVSAATDFKRVFIRNLDLNKHRTFGRSTDYNATPKSVHAQMHVDLCQDIDNYPDNQVLGFHGPRNGPSDQADHPCPRLISLHANGGNFAISLSASLFSLSKTLLCTSLLTKI